MSSGFCKAMGDPNSDDPGMRPNPECICPTAMAAMVCMTGHMLECHYPMTCAEAECEHFKRAQVDEEAGHVFAGDQ